MKMQYMMFIPIVLILIFKLIPTSNAEVYAFKFSSEFYFEEFSDAPATFGDDLSDHSLRGMLINAVPPSACNESLIPAPPYIGNIYQKWILLIPRFAEQNCSFEIKIRMAQLKGYDAVIIYNVGSNELVPMHANNASGIFIPAVFVGQNSGKMLQQSYANSEYFIIITSETPFNIQTHLLIPFAIFVGICFLIMFIFMIVKFIKDRRRERRYRLPKSQLNKIPTCKFQNGDRYETCAICLDDYIENEKLRVLPCNHVYHMKCIDPWLTKNKRVCPICKRKVFAHNEPHLVSDSDSDTDDTTPLMRPGNRTTTAGGTFEVQHENPFRRAARSISQAFEGRNFVTTSGHHSINNETRSIASSSADDSSSNSNDSSASTSIGNEVIPPPVDFVVHLNENENILDHTHSSGQESVYHDCNDDADVIV